MRVLSLSGAYLLPVFVLALHSVMDILAMPVGGGPRHFDLRSLGLPIPRPVRSRHVLNLFFQILHQDPGTTKGPHFALWMSRNRRLSVLEDKANVVKRENKVVEEHNMLKLELSPTKEILDSAHNIGLTVYCLGAFLNGQEAEEALLTQLGSLREKDEISLFLAAWTFASTASHPDPVVFHPAAHDPSRLPLIFLSAMTMPGDDFQDHYGLPAGSWRVIAAETPSETQERVKAYKVSKEEEGRSFKDLQFEGASKAY
ncbi:hypothetical protein C8R42DRAFT_206258 [Lentinula raphanica]|nr:hypothetical protein C8R42DRAFT_206258 [Lentinula raphanica]